ncbi:MAG TPA: sigma-54 dependent transcriptional regulator, partial [Candidatus Aminicenantes bacterium]|nr:sigma-54 dependent transcriptional regulator [Candidatus Aminicenantes bacterium]
QERQENRRLKMALFRDEPEQPQAFHDIVTGDRVMRAIFRYVEAVAGSPLPVLVTGESGTGKELVALALHRTSGRRGEFVAVNIAGFDDNLFSDALFGHRRGAFTGADRERRGLIEQASHGTLFLDEIGELSKASQVKLLRLLQEKQYYPLGADTPLLTDCRVVVATNRDLKRLIETDSFRRDLYYRLQTHHVHLPPLRERRGDLPLLVDHFLEKGCRLLGKFRPAVPPTLMAMLASWSFPGNVRELESLVMDALSRSTGRVLSLQAFRERMNLTGPEGVVPSEPSAEGGPEGEESSLRFPGVLPTLAELESQYLCEAMRRAEGNQTLAARLTGLKRKTFNYRWQQHVRRGGEKDR